MPVIFTFMLASFPAGLVIYWAWNNSLSVEYNDIVAFNGVDEAVRKPGETTAAYARLQEMPSFGMARDTVRDRYHLDQKGLTETRSLRVIPPDSFVEFDLGNLKKSNHHGRYLAAISLRSLPD